MGCNDQRQLSYGLTENNRGEIHSMKKVSPTDSFILKKSSSVLLVLCMQHINKAFIATSQQESKKQYSCKCDAYSRKNALILSQQQQSVSIEKIKVSWLCIGMQWLFSHSSNM